jgi:hypothetical protein
VFPLVRVLLCLSCVWVRRATGGRVSTRLCVLVVGGGRWLLESIPFPDAAVYHTCKMHGHGEEGSHGSQQKLRNKQGGSGRDWLSGDGRDGGSKWCRGRVLVDAKCQNVGLAVLKYERAWIGEIQHEARSRCSASSEWPW